MAPKLVFLSVPVYRSALQELRVNLDENWLIIAPKLMLPYLEDSVTKATVIGQYQFAAKVKGGHKFKEFSNILYWGQLPTLRSKLYRSLRKVAFGKSLYLSLDANGSYDDRSLEIYRLMSSHQVIVATALDGTLEEHQQKTQSLIDQVVPDAKAKERLMEYFVNINPKRNTP
ncbi:hypothetical protein VPHK449_0030 [Vibrio phage K449]|nr:hypothetical protein SIPHO049v1_p0013 [Vibrio phage PS14A.1]